MVEKKSDILRIERMLPAIGGQKGYTLIEIIMVIVILGVLGAFTFQMVVAGVQAFKKSSARKDILDQGRIALERMVRELRDGKEITDCSSNSITFKKAHPAQAADNVEEVKFEFDDINKQLKRVGDPNGNEGGPYAAVLASNVTSFQLGEGGGAGSVTVDASSSGTATAGATGITISSYTVAGSDRLMLVGVSIMNAAEDEPTDPPGEAVSSITWNGTNLTIVGFRITTDTDDGRIEIWKLVAPTTGTGNVVINFNRAITQEAVAGVVTFTGVDPADPLGNFASSAGDDTTSATVNIPSASGETVFGVICAEYEPLTASSGQTEHWNASVSGTNAAGGTAVAASSSVAMSWSLNPGTSNHWAIGGVSIKPKSTSTTCSAGAGAVTFDNVSSTTSSDNPMTLSHTIGGGSNRLLIVGISAECNDGITVTSVTYNGQPLTKAASVQADTGTVGTADLWYLLEAGLPPAGAYNVEVTTSGYTSKSVGAVSLEGVAQQAPEATNTNTNVGPDYISTGITTLTDGAWVVDVVENGNADAFTPDGGQTQRYQEPASSSNGAASTKEMATAGSTSMGWSANANRLAHVVAAFAPASAGSPLLSLGLTLTDPEDEENSINLRTKVYMRNMP